MRSSTSIRGLRRMPLSDTLRLHRAVRPIDQQVSSHLLIDRRGRCTQYVPFDRRAWHAGASSWRGRPGCNDFAIGIELEGTDARRYTAAQYRRLVLVTDALFKVYPRLAPDAIVGHFEIASGRKTDPGPSFDWSRYLLNLTRPAIR